MGLLHCLPPLDEIEASPNGLVARSRTFGAACRSLFPAWLLLAFTAPVFGLTIFQPSPGKNVVFPAWTSSPAEGASMPRNGDAGFLGSGYDLTGIGWMAGTGTTPANSRAFQVALVTPVHFYTAAHANMVTGSVISFVSGEGAVWLKTVTRSNTFYSRTGSATLYANDVSTGHFGTAFSNADGVAPLRLLDVADRNYAFMPVLVTGSELTPWNGVVGDRGPLVASDKIMPGSSTASLVPFYANWNELATVPGTDLGAETGDSGSPVLITYADPEGRKSATLAGSWWTGGSFGILIPKMPESMSVNATISSAYGAGFYDPITPINDHLKGFGYALRWTIYESASGGASAAPVWTGGAADGARLSTPGNWAQGSSVPAASPATLSSNATRGFAPAVFNENRSGVPRVVMVDAATGLRGMLFKSAPGAAGFVFQGTDVLSLDYSGIRNEAAALQKFAIPVRLTSSQNWEAEAGPLEFTQPVDTGPGNLVVISGPFDTTLRAAVTGNGSLAKDGAGELLIEGNCTYSGQTTLHDGTTRLGATGQLPSSALVFLAPNAARLELAGRVQTFSDVRSEFGGTGTIDLGAGGLLTVLAPAGGNGTFAGTVVGSSGIVKAGPGAWRISGNLSQSGNLSVSGGLLSLEGRLDSASSVRVGAGAVFRYAGPVPLARPVVLEGGSLLYDSPSPLLATLAGNGTIGGSGNLGSGPLDVGGGRVLAPGNPVGRLTGGDLVWGDGGAYEWELTNPGGAAGSADGWDLIELTGNLRVTASSQGFVLRLKAGPLSGWNPSVPWQWRIVSAAGGAAGFDPSRVAIDSSGFTASNSPAGGTFALSSDAGGILLSFEPALPGEFSDGAGSVTEGLAGFWKCDDGQGAVASDASGSQSPRPWAIPSPANTSWSAAGKFSGCLDFDGTAGARATFSAPELTAFTLSAWVWLDSRGYFPRLLELAGLRVLLRSDNNFVGLSSTRTGGNADWWGGGTTIPLGAWQHVVVSWDSSSNANQPAFYLNGIKLPTVAFATPAGAQASNAGTAYLGNRADGQRPLDGRLDQVRLYSRVLSDAEVGRLFADHALPSPGSVIAGPVASGIRISWSLLAGSGITYKVARADVRGGPYVFIGSPTAEATFTDTTAEPGKSYFYSVTAGRDGIGGEISVAAAASAWTRLQTWRAASFGSPAATGAASDTGDDDRDGLPNLVEYAIGGDPHAADADRLHAGLGPSGLELSFQRLADPAITYIVQGSDNLVNWTPIWSSAGQANSSGQVTVSDPTPYARGRFLRLQVISP